MLHTGKRWRRKPERLKSDLRAKNSRRFRRKEQTKISQGKQKKAIKGCLEEREISPMEKRGTEETGGQAIVNPPVGTVGHGDNTDRGVKEPESKLDRF